MDRAGWDINQNFIPMASPIDYVNAGQIQPLDDLLSTYAPNVYAQASRKGLGDPDLQWGDLRASGKW